MNLNKVYLVGRLAADPEIRTTPTGQQVASVRLATNRVWSDRNTGQKQEQTEFHTIVAWGNLADICGKYLHKGQLAMFEGRLQTRSWQGQDGVKRYRTEVVAENMQLGPRQSGAPAGAAAPVARVASPASAPAVEEEIPIINEDVPITDPISKTADVEESEINLKDIPF